MFKAKKGTALITDAIQGFKKTSDQLTEGIKLCEEDEAAVDAQIAELQQEKKMLCDFKGQAQAVKDNINNMLGV